MQIVTGQQMEDADRRSVEAGVPISTLMENAGRAVARLCERYFPGTGLVVVLCGRGNNGGDGMVAARRLAETGRPVRVVLLGGAAGLHDEPEEAWRQIVWNTAVEPVTVSDEEGLRDVLRGATLVVDAVVGTGFKPPLRGLAAHARDLLAAGSMPVVAVDLPSGWNADSTQENAEATPDSADAGNSPSADLGVNPGRASAAFRADAVVTFAAPKPAHVFGHLTSGKTFGPVVVAPIGTPEGALPGSTALHWAGTAKALAEAPRERDGNKGQFGHLLVMGGSFGKAGAPSMASLAALRAGAGLVTAAVPRAIVPTVARVTPELMCLPLDEEDGGLAMNQLAPDALARLLKGISVVGMGPGLGQEGSTPEWVRAFVERVTVPLVIDADALNALAGHTDVLTRAAAGKDKHGNPRVLVLTPHPGEMARLIGGTVKDVQADRLGLARRFATEHGVTLVLKGWRTLVAHPDGRIAVNTTGNPAMAKGGSGDILTGIVSAMVAQFPNRLAEAVEAAVFLHGLAGDYAALDQDEHTVLATDTVAHLARAFRARVIDEDGFTWIAGMAAHVPVAMGLR